MDKTYDPTLIEKTWAERWEERGYFKAGGSGEPFCIMLPPPNVTGTLHMGHAFNNTIMDALTRYHRMNGRNTLWQPGTDHAGIATQMVVERQLGLEGKSRHDLGRGKFLERVWQWKEQSGNTIQRQLRRLGSSLDWSRDRFTMDEGLSEAVTEVFVRLHEQGLIYRGKRLVNWDPVLHTAISDLEVISEEENGSLWHLRYPLADGAATQDGQNYIVVATTRPETMLGDAAVAVNPNDERYTHLVGKQVLLPLTGRTIPIIDDDYVDPAFGTGCVKITPAHDFNDYAVGQRHQLPLLNIFTRDAAINDEAPAAYRGMDRFKARKQIVADLQAQDLIEKIEPHKLKVPRGDRSGVVVEPYLTDQWYVKIEPLAAEAIKVVEDGRVRFVPENWSKTYFEWMRNIQDWCISRQLWWGHRIPAWYDTEGKFYVAKTALGAYEKYLSDLFKSKSERSALVVSVLKEIVYIDKVDEIERLCDLHGIPKLVQDEDVLDTWFSSALWPFSTLGWPAQTPELKTYYPTSVLVTGFDIIFFWVARMIMMGCKFMGDVPFHEVYIHGLVRDAEGQKMSKSKGNILDPIDLIDGIDLESLVAKRTTGLMKPQDAPKIEKATRKEFPDGIAAFGTDALRFTFAILATQGRDIRFDVKRIEGYRNFCNKLWNASRYVLLSLEGQEASLTYTAPEFGLAETWIRSRLQNAIAAVNEYFSAYRFDLAATAIYEFVWDEFCDWYLELSKVVLTDAAASEAAKAGTRQTLVRTLETLLRLAHPITPYITEEIWQRVAPLAGVKGETIMRQPFPHADSSLINDAAIREIDWVKSAILGVRRIRSEMNIAPSRQLAVLVQGGSAQEHVWLENARPFIGMLARITRIDKVVGTAPESAMALAGEMSILIPLADVIDPEAELKRLNKELDGKRGELERAKNKLANESYVSRAPAEVVAKERARAEELQAAIGKLEEQVAKIAQMRSG